MAEAIGSALLVEPVPPQERLDGPLFDALYAATDAKETYQLLTIPTGRRAELLADFAESGAEPDLSATHLDLSELEVQHTILWTFKAWLLSGSNADVPPDVIQMYRWKVNEQIANIRIARASLLGDTERFRRYNVFVYGEPDPQVAAAVADWFRSDALTHAGSEHQPVRDAAAELLHLVADRGGQRQDLVPDPVAFQRVRAEHYRDGGYYALLLAGVELPRTGPVTTEIGNAALLQVRANLGAGDYAIVDAAAGAWSVNNRQREVSRPATMNMILERFVGLVGHEWGSHVLEWLNGTLSGVGLAALGFDRYENGNETRALLREEVVYKSFDEFAKTRRWQDVMRRQFAIALGHGTPGYEPMTFGQVHAVLSTVDRLWERARTPGNPERADARARQRTDDLLMRVLKGTNGKGGAYLKDKVYLEPHADLWQAAGDNPAIIGHGDRLKCDMLNERHTNFAAERGIIPRVNQPAEGFSHD
ncbi:MAG TPA: hypothetical protein VLE99_03330 [Candidatus Saccharimonadales bacterium]|nr:hypothetical protein [Candidatus Saccharimonadales bacterium]